MRRLRGAVARVLHKERRIRVRQTDRVPIAGFLNNELVLWDSY